METQRLLLRPWQESDAADLYEYARDSAVGPAAGWPPHKSVEDSRQIIKTVLSDPETYAVILKATGRAVGSAGIMLPSHAAAAPEPDQREIGYWIGVPYWGQGLIPEAVECLLQRCFEELGCSGVWCGYFDGNVKSKRAQEKCGFIYHHTAENVKGYLGSPCTEHFTFQTRAQWQEHIANRIFDRK